MAAIAPEFVEIDQLQRAASRVIARLTGGRGGVRDGELRERHRRRGRRQHDRRPTSSPSSACRTRPGCANEVLIQVGHMVSYGAPVDQSIRLAGGTVVPVGTVSSAYGYQLEKAITERTASALYVVSHHTVQYGMIGLEEFCEICRAQGRPGHRRRSLRIRPQGLPGARRRHRALQRPQVPGRPDHRHRRGPQGPRPGRLSPEPRHRPRHEGRQGEHRRRDGGPRSLGEARPCGHPRARARGPAALARRPAPIRGVAAAIVPDPTDNPLDRLRVDGPAGERLHRERPRGGARRRGSARHRARPRDRAGPLLSSIPATFIPARPRSSPAASSRP